jgi:putative membrane protein
VSDDRAHRAGDRGSATAGECEPDYRFTLANERTFLAWQRSARGLLAAAVAVLQLVPELVIPGARHVVGALLAVLAMLTGGMGLLRSQQADRAIRRGKPLPCYRIPAYLAVVLPCWACLPLGW